jgi:hypothetical protein
MQVHELSERLRERAGGGGATAATASSSSCNNDELDDDKRNVVAGCVDLDVEPLESCVLGGTACATPADVSLSVESDCGDHLHYDDGAAGGFPPDSFCATPELWEPWPWPPIELYT